MNCDNNSKHHTVLQKDFCSYNINDGECVHSDVDELCLGLLNGIWMVLCIPPSVGMSENDVCPQMAIIIGRRMISSNKPMCLWSSIVITVLQIIVTIILKKWSWSMIMNVGKLNKNNVIETRINNNDVSITEGGMVTTVIMILSGKKRNVSHGRLINPPFYRDQCPTNPNQWQSLMVMFSLWCWWRVTMIMGRWMRFQLMTLMGLQRLFWKKT